MRGNGKESSAPIGGNPLDELFQIKPGDVLDFFMEGPRLVKTLLSCREEYEGHAYEWIWTFLDDGSLVEASPDGYFRYREHELIKQGTGAYEELVAQDGALVRFEERVREGSSADRPVEFTLDDHTYRITSSGIVSVGRLGDEPALLPWQSFGGDPKNNVYFGLEDASDDARVGLGLWTAHVCISVGKSLEPADVSTIYRK